MDMLGLPSESPLEIRVIKEEMRLLTQHQLDLFAGQNMTDGHSFFQFAAKIAFAYVCPAAKQQALPKQIVQGMNINSKQ